MLFTLVSTVHAAELKPQTVQAWQLYVQSAIARMQERLRSESHFLRVDEDQNWIRRIRNGEILVLPGGSQSLHRVPSGIVHDWLGAAFIGHATIDDVLLVARDYDRYKEFYRPTVVESRTIRREANYDDFSMVLMNPSLFLKTALEGDYRSSCVHLSGRRSYSISETTRIQEIENYGAPSQRTLREGQGNGFIWRLVSITRLEERDQGVYIELECIVLSRDIPISLRWIIEPIVRRIARSSLETSIRQTEDAVHSNAAFTVSDVPGRLRSNGARCMSRIPGFDVAKSRRCVSPLD